MLKELLIGILAFFIIVFTVGFLVYCLPPDSNEYSCVDGVVYHKSFKDVWVKSELYGPCIDDKDMQKRSK